MFQSLSSTADSRYTVSPAHFTANRDRSRTTRPRGTGQTALSLNQMTTYRQSFAEDVLGCEAAGIGRLGVWRRKLDDFGVERAAELLDDHRVSVSSLSWGGGFTGGNGLTFDEAVDETRSAIYQAARLKAHALTVVSGGRAGHIHSHARRLLLDGLAATVEIAAEHGIHLALQPMAPEYAEQWTFLDSLEEALEIVCAFDHPFLGLAVGTCHIWQQPQILELLEHAAPCIVSVQLSDWNAERGDDARSLPGEGDIALDAMVQALQRGGYRGDYELDVWSTDLWKADPASWLNKCARSCQQLIAGSPVPAQ